MILALISFIFLSDCVEHIFDVVLHVILGQSVQSLALFRSLLVCRVFGTFLCSFCMQLVASI